MNKSESILKRQKYRSRFKNEDMDFIFNWLIGISQVIGMSASQIFYAIHGIKDGDPKGWRDGFNRMGKIQLEHAGQQQLYGENLAAGQAYMGAAYAFRAELQYTDPMTAEFNRKVEELETAFLKGIRLLGVPSVPIEIPFEGISLPGYYLEHTGKPRPTVIMIGGGDTYREDLFYFAGYPGWKRGYNVLMVDLPGQGKVPGLGKCFRVDMDKPIKAAIDWLEANASGKPDRLALYGVSGGGYFTAQGVACDKRINAWIASTPITNVGVLFEREFGYALKAPGWLLSVYMKFAGAMNESTKINLKKYAWQFGTSDFKAAVEAVINQAVPVNISAIDCPSLLLLGENESSELIRQTEELYEILKKRGIAVTLRKFTAAEGADAHCQVNNLRLLHMVIFNWLDKVFDYDKMDEDIDRRLFC